MTKHISIERKRANRLQDAYILFIRHKIDMDEYKRLQDMINSPDEGNLCVAIAIIKEKFRKHAKKGKDN
jgi:hypothetical protein